MNIQIENLDEITLIDLIGDLDANTAPQVQERVLPIAQTSGKILLNMAEVPYLSSAGLRMLLHLYRQVGENKGKVVLVALVEEIRETMEVTGFLQFFDTYETLDKGVEALVNDK
ncbi:anti-sigma factor antagonist [Oscillatoriales cyanobacterium LEGE 11467]|uniref:Anti-sigma factor antagonist n=1 Tax=Zarconia navalis LEGE 11467 TaxID=1828826 RepID=A0A928Z734_9CYAN|nr:anti-sigma factor antagonist [Zarconia navalis]MBE9040150.1 anti-sigma factor antagonist [Zarconia navalis LEGE 11467]